MGVEPRLAPFVRQAEICMPSGHRQRPVLPHTACVRSGRIWPPPAGTFARIIDGHLDRRSPPGQPRRAESAADIDRRHHAE
jgi:hypothetical protein